MIKKYIYNKLGIDDLLHKIDKLTCEISKLEETNSELLGDIQKLKDDSFENTKLYKSIRNQNHESITKLEDKVEAIHNTIENTLKLSLDIGGVSHLSKNWGVICYSKKGHPIVRFVDFEGCDYRDVEMFIERFKAYDKTIDAPSRHFIMEDVDFWNIY